MDITTSAAMAQRPKVPTMQHRTITRCGIHTRPKDTNCFK